MPKFTPKSVQEYEKKRKIAEERRLTVNVFVFVLGFALAWSPYAFVSMWSAFKNFNDIPPLFHTSLAIFGKSCMVWAPMLFIFANQNIMNKLRTARKRSFESSGNLFCCKTFSIYI